MKTQNKQFCASLTFPVKVDETWTVRNGIGNTVERWTVTHSYQTKEHTYFTVKIEYLW